MNNQSDAIYQSFDISRAASTDSGHFSESDPADSFPGTSILSRFCIATSNLLDSYHAKAISAALAITGTVALTSGTAIPIGAAMVASGGSLFVASSVVSISRCIASFNSWQSLNGSKSGVESSADGTPVAGDDSRSVGREGSLSQINADSLP